MSKKREFENALSDRLELCLEGQNHRQVAEATGSNPETVRRWRLAGNPPPYFLVRMARHYQISLKWLLTGEGTMYLQDETASILRNTSTEEILAELARRISWNPERDEEVRDPEVRVYAHTPSDRTQRKQARKAQ